MGDAHQHQGKCQTLCVACAFGGSSCGECALDGGAATQAEERGKATEVGPPRGWVPGSAQVDLGTFDLAYVECPKTLAEIRYFGRPSV